MNHAPLRDQDLAAKVAALKRPLAYPEPAGEVTAVQTHMSWVFLTGQHAYKLKKPVREDYLDFSTLSAREHYCREELRLNQRLAPGVYLDVVPLRRDSRGELRVAGAGETVEWLVKMRRLDAERMLDRMIRTGPVPDARLAELGGILAAFYRDAPRAAVGGAQYLANCRAAVTLNLRLLGDPRFELGAGAPQRVHSALLALIEREADSFGARAARVVEAHGDLRPEHICLSAPPVIYDRLEFNRGFRLLDPAEELSYLAMECELLGAPSVGARVFEVYVAGSGDDPPAPVRHWYMANRACLRARLAARHILDRPREDWGRWLAEARRYLDAAERHCQAVNPPTAR
jgi:aminoglycoside phosphotransferase family enzyme